MKNIFIALLTCLQFTGWGQLSQADRDSIAKYTRLDYLQMLDQLGLEESDMRPGPSGNPQAPIAANRFEDQVREYVLPDPLILNNGQIVQYAGILTVDDLPVDAHQLIALCAPRPVFISSGSPYVEGQWIDAMGMFQAGVHAGPV